MKLFKKSNYLNVIKDNVEVISCLCNLKDKMQLQLQWNTLVHAISIFTKLQIIKIKMNNYNFNDDEFSLDEITDSL